MAVSATQTSTLFVDLDDDGVIDPGDTVLTSVVISNVGPAALDVAFNETLNGMTLVDGTLNVSPLALDDFYEGVGNTLLVVGTVAGAPGGPSAAVAGNVIANDVEFLGDSFVISAFDATSANGGTVDLVTTGADRGSFSYLPAAGFTGADTFTYTIRDAGIDGIQGNADDLTSVGIVTITVGGIVWYVDNSGANGDGRSSSPFNSLAAVNGIGDADAPGEIIYLRTGSGSYTGGITLENNQTLWGENEALVVGGYTLRAAGADPTITNAAGSGVTLAQNNTLKGFSVGDTSVADIVDGNASVGNLTISNVNLSGTGQAIDIDQGGTLNVTIDTLTSTSSAAQGVQLAGTDAAGAGLLSGTFTATAGAISGTTGTAFLVGDGAGGANTGGTVAITYGGTITTTGDGASVDIQDRLASAGNITFSGNISHTSNSASGIVLDDNAGGNITFSGATKAINTSGGAAAAVSISDQTGGTVLFSSGGLNIDTTAGAGVNLTNNTGGTINFTGGTLTIDTTTGVGFSATGGGTVTAQGSGNTINSTSATALDVVNTTIGAAGLTFRSISAGNDDGAPDPVNGIVLNSTGSSGGFTVTGDPGSAFNVSGGTIQNTTGAGISLINTRNVSLDQMSIETTGDSGINGSSVTNFSFTNGAITDAGDAGFESAIGFNDVGTNPAFTNNINGTLTVTGSTFTDAFYAALDVRGNDGTVTNANVSNNTIINPGSSGISFVGSGNSLTAFSLNDATIHDNAISGSGGSGIQLSIENLSGNGPAAHAGLVTFVPEGPKPFSDPDNIISITGNTIALDPTGTNAIVLTNSGAANVPGRPQMNFEVTDNTLTGSATGDVVLINANGTVDTVGLVDNNIVDANHTPNTGLKSGIAAGTGPAGAGNVWDPQLNLTVTNNTVTDTDAYGIYLYAAGGAGESYLTVANNSVQAPLAGSSSGIFVVAGDAASLNDSVFLNIFGNTSAGNGVDGIALWKQGNDSAVNIFGILDKPGDPSLADDFFPTNAEVEAFIEALNTGGAVVVVGDNFVKFVNESDPNVFGPYIPQALLAAEGGLEAADTTEGSVVPGSAVSPASEPANSSDSGTPPEDASNDPVAGPDQPDEDSADQGLGSSVADVVIDDGVLTQAELDFTVSAALARWEAAGLTAAQVTHLHNATFTVADMPGLYLGSFAPGVVTLDSDGAGYGWFVDATPGDDLEFANTLAPTQLRADPWQAPAGRMDLLTTIMHEMGHHLGVEDSYLLADRASLAYGYLFTGERRLPGPGDADGAVAGSIQSEEFLAAPVNIGTLPGGKSVTIQWHATVDAQTNQLITNLSNQGTVSGSNFASVLTDDPGVGGASNPNITQLDSLSLGNVVFNDVNGNRIFDSGEGVNGVALTLYADTNGNGVFDPGGADTLIASTTTATVATVAGTYSFTNLSPGNYILQVDQSNFGAGGALELLPVSVAGNPDPDNNIDNDDNGAPFAGQGIVSLPITLAYNEEPTNGPGNDTNNTLDIGVSDGKPLVTPSGGTTAFIEGNNVTSTPVAIDSAVSVNDSDSTLASGTVSITGNFQSTQDVLAFANDGSTMGNIAGSYDAGSGVLSLTSAGATATLAQWQAALRAVTYTNTSETPSTANRTLSFAVNDGDATSVAGTKLVSVTAVDDSSIARDDAFSTVENVVLGSLNLFADNGSGADSDVDSPLNVTAVNGSVASVGNQITLASGALLTLNPDGTATYDPNGKFNYVPAPGSGASNLSATDTFDYTLTGGSTATVTVTITGIDNDDTLEGTAGPDFLFGGNGNDTFIGTLPANGTDFLDGGPGTDTADFSTAGAAILVSLNASEYEVLTQDLPTLTGGTWRPVADLVSVENLVGTAFDDALYGNGADNVLGYTGGLDVLDGGGGVDTADFSRFGSAILVSLNASEYEVLTQDLPTLTGGTWRPIADLASVENLIGTAHDDALYGNGANNIFVYTGGLDVLDGGGGVDTADFSRFGSAILVSLNASEYEVLTTDAATVGTGIFRALADVSNMEIIIGTSLADELYGNGDANHFQGGAGADRLDGGGGNDVLAGGPGADSLTGGAGADRFVFNASTDGVDIVRDFTSGSGNDVLDLRDILIGQSVNAGNLAEFVQLGPQGQASTVLSVDVNGAAGGASFVNLAILEGVTGLVLGDMFNQGNLLVS